MVVNPTKVRPPVARSNHLPRTRVDALIETGAAGPLTVLQAAAGCGKTTALAAWAGMSGRPVAWLTLDGQDDDPRRLLVDVVEAFIVVTELESLGAVLAAVQNGADLPGRALPMLAEVLAGEPLARLVLVLDDYHELHAAPVHALVRALIDLLSPSIPVLIASRTKPPLRLDRRLAAREASVISATQLAFLAEETEALVNRVHGLGLDIDELLSVATGLNGWPVGLALLVLNLLSSGADRPGISDALISLAQGPMVDYVVEEELAHADEGTRRLRLSCSLVDRVNGPLAAALMEDPRAAGMLEEFKEVGQLIALDGEGGGWLTMHPLVRTSLRMALERQDPGMAGVVHERACAWFEANGMLAEAFASAVASGQGARVDELLRRHSSSLILDRRVDVLRLALSSEPGPDADAGPMREAVHLNLRLLEGGHQSDIADRAVVLYERHRELPEVQVHTAVLIASPFGGDVARGIRVGYEALERFADRPQFVARLRPALAGCLMFDGRYMQARTLVESLIAPTSAPWSIYAHSFLARINLVEGDPATAAWHGQRAVELLEGPARDAGDFVWVRAALADALRVNGRLVEARANLEHSLSAEQHRPGSVVQGVLLVSDAEMCLTEGRRARARTSLTRARQIFSRYPDVGRAVWSRLEAAESDLAAPIANAATGSMPTPAELRVLELLVDTPSRAAIAAELFLSESTVKSHLRRIYRRLGVTSREEALRVARSRGLLGDRRQPQTAEGSGAG